MTRTHCAALMPDGRRCRHAAAPNGLFCPAHAAFTPESEHPFAVAAPGPEPFSSAALRQWLLGTLQTEMMALCAADLPPLDRAEALTDLGELFLQALPGSEDLDCRVAELEARAAEVERKLERG